MAPSKQTVEEVSLCFFLFLRSTNNPFLQVNLFKGGRKLRVDQKRVDDGWTTLPKGGSYKGGSSKGGR